MGCKIRAIKEITLATYLWFPISLFYSKTPGERFQHAIHSKRVCDSMPIPEAKENQKPKLLRKPLKIAFEESVHVSKKWKSFILNRELSKYGLLILGLEKWAIRNHIVFREGSTNPRLRRGNMGYFPFYTEYFVVIFLLAEAVCDASNDEA
ncbi:hypothetical protein Fot_42283 [Forsythia ovata]|uniref:Uncharacterized protein n=1 Tax=Forsythia ovata TaxID=205694 RepID=A0ABD1RKQ1_9LAMI